MNEFEQKLSRQPLQKIPAEWREEILSAASLASRPKPNASFFSTLNHQLSTFFWPHPAAWGALATIWVFIFILDFSIRDKTPAMAEKISPPSPEVIAELKQQQRMFAELVGLNEPHDMDRQKSVVPGPRSERVGFLMG